VTGTVRALLEELRDDPAAAAEWRRLLAPPPAAYTPQTLAAELGITARAIRAAIDRGDLEARKSGRRYVIGTAAVAAWTAAPARRPRRAARPGTARTMRDAITGNNPSIALDSRRRTADGVGASPTTTGRPRP
jgi:excisionase family DNA binding protein